jgi:hypothetical protein
MDPREIWYLNIFRKYIEKIQGSLISEKHNGYCEGGKLPVAQLVEALRYRSESRGFDSRWCH